MQPDARTAKSLQIVEGIVAMIGDQTDEAKGSEVFRRWLKYQHAMIVARRCTHRLVASEDSAYQSRQYI